MNTATQRHRPPAGLVIAALAWLLSLALPALAETRVWLDRSQVDEGETVTLNIETDQPGIAPDFGPLQADFDVGTPYRDDRAAGTLFGVRLLPRRSGTLEVPALRVGGERTQARVLRVLPAQDVPRGDVFVENRLDETSPWVQQSVGLVVRLYYATSLLSGELVQEAPEGASLQRIGEDVTGRRRIGAREYRFVERRYLLVPERSGSLRLPAPRFSGKAAPRFFDDFLGTDRSLSAEGQARELQVRAQPADAPQPWLPLHDLRLRYLQPPTGGRAGEAVEVVVEAQADGATGAQLPEIPVPQVEGAQVFAERAQTSERFVDGSPRLTVVRRFAVVPLQPGPLRVPGPELQWWDAAAGKAQRAGLPDLQLDVAAASASGPAAVTPDLAGSRLPPAISADAVPLATAGEAASAAGAATPWRWLSLLLGLLWLATLAWALRLRTRWKRHRRRRRAPPRPGTAAPTADALRRALDADSFDEAVRVLQAMARPPAADLDEVIARLADPAQQDALQVMRQSLWAGEGDPARARLGLRAAFRHGPRWRGEAPVADSMPLPPLYPPRQGG